MMKRKYSFLFLTLLICLIFLAGCSARQMDQQPLVSGSQSYTFTDSAGVSLTVKQPPQRVAVLFSSFAEIWQTAGGTVAVTVGETVERGLVKDADVKLVDGGAGKTIDTELLLSYAPDFVICSMDIKAQAEAAELLNQNGIPSAQFVVESVDDYLKMLKICTDITQNREAYQTAGTEMKARVAQILAEAKQKSGEEKKEILFIRAGTKYSSTKAKTKDDNFVCKMLDELGTYNIAENAPVLLDGLSMEEILKCDPDYIFITTMGDEDAAKAYMNSRLERPEWQGLTAVKNQQYAYLPKDLFHFKPNARWDEAYQYLSDLLYPDPAGDSNVTEK